MMRRISIISATSLALAMGFAAQSAHAAPTGQPQAYVNSYDGVDVGENTTLLAAGTNLGAVTPLAGPRTTGQFDGQFDITCPTVGGCTTTAYFAANTDWRWGLLDVTDMDPFTAFFVANGSGETLFGSSEPNEGFGTVTLGGVGNEDARFVEFLANLEDSDTGFGGVTMAVGRKYVLVAITVAGFDAPFATAFPSAFGSAEFSAYTSAILDNAPFQLHDGNPQAYADIFADVSATQAATSRIIPIVPEPATVVLLAGGLAFVARRRRK